MEERKASQKYTTANAGSISRRINKKRLVEKAEQMKGKQCVVTPQNYYWMKKKKITTEKVKNNLAVAHVFKWLEWPAITRAMNEARRTLFHLSHITSSRAVLLTLMSNLHLYSIPCLTFSPSVAPQVTFEIDK